MSEEIKETRQEGILFTIDYLKDHKFNFDYCLDELIEETTNLQNQLQQKENIIKEVRKYIKNNTYKTEWGDFEEDNEDININDDLSEKNFIESILEILDKGE